MGETTVSSGLYVDSAVDEVPLPIAQVCLVRPARVDQIIQCHTAKGKNVPWATSRQYGGIGRSFSLCTVVKSWVWIAWWSVGFLVKSSGIVPTSI